MKGYFKHIGLFFFLSLIAFQLLHKTVYALYFICNQGAVAEAHCVNKDRPEVKCDGRCHLKKYLTQDSLEEEEKQAPENRLWQNPEELPLQFCESIEVLKLDFYILCNTGNKEYAVEAFYKDHAYQAPVFHPPIA